MDNSTSNPMVFWLPLVRLVASEIRCREQLEFGDLVGYGCIGLATALNRFDSNKGEFRPFAMRHIYGAIVDGIRLWRRVPRPEKRRYFIPKTKNVNKDEIVDPKSINEHYWKADLDSLLPKLTEKRREVIQRYWLSGEFAREIASSLRISESAVCDMNRRAISKLREMVTC